MTQYRVTPSGSAWRVSAKARKDIPAKPTSLTVCQGESHFLREQSASNLRLLPCSPSC